MIKVLLIISMLFWFTVASAIEPRTEHTYRLSEGESATTASLDDLSWLVGSWSGTAFGNTFEEVWNPPSAGSMVGMFKVINNDAVEFYELMTLSHVDGRLTLKVKHFTADFVAWEDKPDFTKFPLVALDKDAVHFSGISFYRRDDNHIDGYIVLKTQEGIREEKLTYQRSTPLELK